MLNYFLKIQKTKTIVEIFVNNKLDSKYIYKNGMILLDIYEFS